MSYRRILVPVDGSATSNNALKVALRMARESGGRVRIVHAIDDLAFVSPYAYSGNVLSIVREQAETLVGDALALAKAAEVNADRQLIEDTGIRLGEAIAAAANDWDADLVVVGTHGRRGLSRVLLGSGAESVIRLARVPVLVIRGGEDERKSATPSAA